MLLNKNKTSLILGLIYILFSYLILRYLVPDDTPSWVYGVVIPGGVLFIIILFNYILKYDFFDKNEDKGE